MIVYSVYDTSSTTQASFTMNAQLDKRLEVGMFLEATLIAILPWRHPPHYLSCLVTDSVASSQTLLHLRLKEQCTGCARRFRLDRTGFRGIHILSVGNLLLSGVLLFSLYMDFPFPAPPHAWDSTLFETRCFHTLLINLFCCNTGTNIYCHHVSAYELPNWTEKARRFKQKPLFLSNMDVFVKKSHSGIRMAWFQCWRSPRESDQKSF